MHTDEYSQIRAYINNFIQVTEEEWQLHRNVLYRRFLKKGEYLLRAGQVCNDVSFINSGAVRCYTLCKGEDLTNFFFFENSYTTDYVSFLSRKPSDSYLVALEDTEVLNLSYENMQMLYEKVPSWQKYGRLIAEFVFLLAEERATMLQINSPEELYLKILREQPQIIERVPLQHIASYLAIKPESLSRIRKRLVEQKI
jgi:CRP/FNR family transcriptional regulator, anaerobic regulatory protein